MKCEREGCGDHEHVYDKWECKECACSALLVRIPREQRSLL